MVELRKRSAPAPAVPPPAKRASSTSKVKKAAEKVKAAVVGPAESTTTGDDNAVVNESGVLPETTGTAGDVAEEAPAPVTSNGNASANKLGKESVGQKIEVEGFDDTVTTHDGTETRLATLLERSKMGVVVFTYPKASTPGCEFLTVLEETICSPDLGTTQACLFRDAYAPITSAGYSVYGLSTDSAKSNTTFVNKHSLPYPLLVSYAS